MKIGIAADHGGFALEEHLIAKLKVAGAEYGINPGEGATPLLRGYPTYTLDSAL